MRRVQIIIGAAVVIALVAGVSWWGIGWYMGITGRIAELEKLNAQLTSKPKIVTDDDVIARVGSFMVLPQGRPNIIPVTDVENLKKAQPFFNQAVNGDKLLVFPTRVILYSPTLDKIVEVAVVK